MSTIIEAFKRRAERNDLVTFPPDEGLPKILRPEECEKVVEDISSKGMTMTVTFKPEIHDRWKPATLTRIVKDIMSKYMKRYKFRIILIGDYSDRGMYHMHGGIVAPPKMINSLRRRLPREVGRTELKQVKWSESWARYCVSEPETMNAAKTQYKKLDIVEMVYIE